VRAVAGQVPGGIISEAGSRNAIGRSAEGIVGARPLRLAVLLAGHVAVAIKLRTQ